MGEIARSLEAQAQNVERELSAAMSNYRRMAEVTGAAEFNLKRLEREAAEIRQRLHAATGIGGQPGYRYDLGGKSTENIVRAEIILECCRESKSVMASRVAKYDDQYDKLQDELSRSLIDVDLRRNEEEDMAITPRADKFHLPRPGAFEIFLQYFVELPLEPVPEPTPEQLAAEAEAAAAAAAAGEEPVEKKPKKPKEVAKLIRLFSKLETKKWPCIPKVVKGVRMFLPLKFDRLAKEEEEARLAAIQARIEKAQADVDAAKAKIAAAEAAGQEKVAEAEQTRADSAEVLEAYDKVVADKTAAEEKLEENKASVTTLLQEQKALKDAEAAGDEEAAGKLSKLDGTLKVTRRAIKEHEDGWAEFEATFEVAKGAADEANEKLNRLQAEYDATVAEAAAGQDELVAAEKFQQQEHAELGIPIGGHA